MIILIIYLYQIIIFLPIASFIVIFIYLKALFNYQIIFCYFNLTFRFPIFMSNIFKHLSLINHFNFLNYYINLLFVKIFY